MGFLKSVGGFLFGKDPDIFDENGQVLHKFPEDKWRKWNDRLKANPDYDWRHHVAVKTVEAAKPANTKGEAAKK